MSFFCTLCPNKDDCLNPLIRVFVFVMFPLHLVGVLVTGLHLSVSQLSVDLCNCFTTLLIIRSLLSPNSRSQLLNFPWFERVERGLVHVPVCTGVFTRAHCAAVKTRDGERKKKKKQWEG